MTSRSRRGALTGFVYGLTFFLVLLAWMTVIGMDAWILLSAYCALWNAALGALVAPLSRLRGSVLWIPSAWVVMEALRDGRVIKRLEKLKTFDGQLIEDDEREQAKAEG